MSIYLYIHRDLAIITLLFPTLRLPEAMAADLKRSAEQVVAEMEASKPEGGAVVCGLSPLSETLWKDKTDVGLVGDVSARLTWKDLSVTAMLGDGRTKAALAGLTGYAEPGTLTAIMGPSGSGKSTLLDALAGRLAANTSVSGIVLLNGRKTQMSFGTAAYVTHEDNLIGTLTVREAIAYSARLRLPDNMPWPEKKRLVEGTIDEMGLRDCAGAPIGNWHLRGISTGEKRRVSIALEILMRPRLLFLDEPTGGLDRVGLWFLPPALRALYNRGLAICSASAFSVVQTLRGLAGDGRTVLASVHQPSSEVFQLFDRLCLLSGGKCVYFGPASDAYHFFSQAGFPCPPLGNPSDHFLKCINSDFDKVRANLVGSTKFQKGMLLDSGGSQASFLMQTITLTRRSFLNMTRNFGYYWLRLAIYVFITICIGTINWNIGTSYSSIQAREACASFVFGFVTFMSIGGFPHFVEDMKVFRRERLNGHYGVAAFVVGNTVSAAPFLVLIALASGSICYFMARLHPGFTHYLFFVLCLYASVTVVESLMMAIASVVPNFLLGLMIGAGIQGIFMLVSGHYRLPDDIPKPVWRYPLSYISFHYWALQAQSKNDLAGLTFDNQSPDLPRIPGEYVLQQVLRINIRRSKWVDLSVLFGMIIIYRVIFFTMIKMSEDVTPWIRGYLARRRFLQKKSCDNRKDVQMDSIDRSPSFRACGEDPTYKRLHQ
ncbi:hypothetical protein Taro_024611 [Colocasia esculenta]|uniref:ABC transporter domain-containing protein n=1 Tax=Colocasia esculenta TaxID=4460 RepID=A0A843V9W3_COLES|nr:hypothetical protein [Colocasia esculenta]